VNQVETRALIIKGSNYGESDRILTLITEDLGRIKGIAKGARKSLKRFGGALEPFTLVKLVLKPGKGLAFINDARVLKSYKAIRNDIVKISYGSYIMELADVLSDENHHHDRDSARCFFALTLDSMERLSHAKALEVVVREFEIRLLSMAGYMPSLLECTSCGSNVFKISAESAPMGIAFSHSRGGVVCGKCRGHDNSAFDFISPGTLKTLSGALNGKVSFTKDALNESGRLLSAFISQHLGKRLKSLDFIAHIKGIG